MSRERRIILEQARSTFLYVTEILGQNLVYMRATSNSIHRAKNDLTHEYIKLCKRISVRVSMDRRIIPEQALSTFLYGTEKLGQNLVCMRATSNTIHRAKNDLTYEYIQLLL